MGFGKYIPIVGGIPDSLSCFPDSKAQKYRLLKQNFPDSGKRIPALTWTQVQVQNLSCESNFSQIYPL